MKPTSKILSAVFLLFGISAVVLGLYFLYWGYQSRTWPSVPAKITRTWISHDGGRHPSTDYNVEYSYEVEGQIYLSHQYCFGNSGVPAGTFPTMQSDHRHGISIPAFYNPHSPGTAVLRPGVTSAPPLWCLLGVVFTVVGMFMFFRTNTSSPQNLDSLAEIFPARTRPLELPCRIYPSKIYFGVMTGVLAIFGAGLFYVWESSSHAFPLWAAMVFGGIIALALAATLRSLFSTRPAFVADESGLTCYRMLFPVIPWTDIAHAELIPKTMKYPDGRTISVILERWRPIQLTIKNASDHLAKISPRFQPLFRQTDDPNLMTLQIQFMGFAGSSRDLFDAIQHYTRATG